MTDRFENPTQTPENRTHVPAELAEQIEQSQIASFISGAMEGIHNAVEGVKGRGNQVVALVGATAAFGAGGLIANTAYGSEVTPGSSVTMHGVKKQSTMDKLGKIYDKCGGIRNVQAINVQSGMEKVRTSKGVVGSSHLEDGHAVYNWKYKKGYKYCGLVAHYNVKSTSGSMKFPSPNSATKKTGLYKDPVKFGNAAISQLDIVVAKRSR